MKRDRRGGVDLQSAASPRVTKVRADIRGRQHPRSTNPRRLPCPALLPEQRHDCSLLKWLFGEDGLDLIQLDSEFREWLTASFVVWPCGLCIRFTIAIFNRPASERHSQNRLQRPVILSRNAIGKELVISARRACPVGAQGSQLPHATNPTAAPDGLAPSELKVRS